MKKSVLAAAILAATMSSSAVADWGINVGAINVSPDDSSSNLGTIENVAGLPAGSTQAAVNSNTQLGLTIDYMLTENWALQLIAATPFKHDITVSGSDLDGLNIGETKHLPPTLLAQYHFDVGSSQFRPFVGAGVNYTNFFSEDVHGDLGGALTDLGVITASDEVSMSLRDSWGYALQAGFNMQLTDTLGLHAMVSYMDIDTVARVKVNGDTIQRADVTIDPLVTMVGLRWQF